MNKDKVVVMRKPEQGRVSRSDDDLWLELS